MTAIEKECAFECDGGDGTYDQTCVDDCVQVFCVEFAAKYPSLDPTGECASLVEAQG